jgi:hydrogenase expression/formation protein HypD
MAIARYGIRDALPAGVELISGPGCPVCVTDGGYIDAAVELAGKGVVIATFGDLLPVPGSAATLAECRSRGGAVEVCYSPADAVRLAQERPDREVVFLAVGFETTLAAVAGGLELAVRRGVANFSLLTALKLVPPALHALLADPEIRVDAFLCPAHVSAVIGPEAYLPFAEGQRVPCVIAGFEPLDILLGLQGILDQLNRREARVDNQYSRVVKPGGNARARRLAERYFLPAAARWRGLGLIAASGLRVRPEYAAYDAEARHGVAVQPGRDQPGCLCGDVIKGKTRPTACPLFGRSCTPDRPVGPCMVSTEGTCAACFKYQASG